MAETSAVAVEGEKEARLSGFASEQSGALDFARALPTHSGPEPSALHSPARQSNRSNASSSPPLET